MRVKYTPSDPADGDPQEWDFDPGKLRSVVAEMIETRAGVPIREFAGEVLRGSARPLRTLLWFLKWRDHSQTRFEDVDPIIADIDIVPTSAERQNLREAVSGPKLPPGVTREQADQFLAYLDEQDAIEAAAAAESVAAAEAAVTAADPELVDPAGKA